MLMTYAERDSIRAVIEGFFATGLVDEVLVVDNNAQEGTAEEVRKTRARLVHEPQQGYGHATRRGLLEARGELIVLAEPDGTFLPEDILKLLVYSGECDVVFGTRTTRELIWAERQHGALPALGQLGRGQADRGALQHEPPQRRRLHLPAAARAETAQAVAEAMTRRRQSCRGRDHAADDPLRSPVRRGPRQLPAARGHLVGDRHPLKALAVGLRMIGLVLRYRRHGSAALARPPAFAAPAPGAGARDRMSNSHFDEIATVYDESLPAHVVEHYLRKRAAFVAQVCPAGAALDVGCGTGALAAAAGRTGLRRSSGVDPSEGMLEVMRGPQPADHGGAGPRAPRCRSRTTRFDLVVHRRGDAPHRRARGRGRRRWPRWSACAGPTGGS